MQRRQDVEYRRKQKKLEWLQKMYKLFVSYHVFLFLLTQIIFIEIGINLVCLIQIKIMN